jgi:hypothetical protein
VIRETNSCAASLILNGRTRTVTVSNCSGESQSEHGKLTNYRDGRCRRHSVKIVLLPALWVSKNAKTRQVD